MKRGAVRRRLTRRKSRSRNTRNLGRDRDRLHRRQALWQMPSLPLDSFLIGKMGRTATSLKGSEWGQNEATQKTTHNDRKVTWILIARSPPCMDKGFSAFSPSTPVSPDCLLHEVG